MPNRRGVGINGRRGVLKYSSKLNKSGGGGGGGGVGKGSWNKQVGLGVGWEILETLIEG